MARVAIFTDDPGWHGRRLREAFTARGLESAFVSLTDCRLNVDGEGLPIQIPGFGDGLPNGAFVRGVPGGSLEEVVLYLDILHALNLLGVPVYNSGHAIERSVDKGMTSFLLQRVGIPTPPTWIVRNRLQALCIGERELSAGHDLVSKPLFGSQGEGVQRVRSLEALLRQNGHQGVYYLQRFIDCGDEPHDWRVFVIDGRAIAAMRRCGIDWLNNVAQGARCEMAHVNDEMGSLAEMAVRALNMSYGGVDIIRDQRGDYSVIEVNGIPAWKGLQSVCDLNVADLLADHFLAQLDPCRKKFIAAA